MTLRLFTSALVDDSAQQSTASILANPASAFGSSELWTAELLLMDLNFRVLRKPQDLLAHWQRIRYCFDHCGSEQLFAALLDLLIILNHKGRDFAQRMIIGSRSRLEVAQFNLLRQADASLPNLKGNRHSLFTRGLIGQSEVVSQAGHQQEQHDYLALARDFIEYSQIEEAMTTLELGLNAQPERKDLQRMLLEIYRSSQNFERFQAQYKIMKKMSPIPLAPAWQALADYFASQSA